jgi:predicted nucleotidyltransferase component of viral defense system
MTTDLENSLKSKLRQIAKERQQDPLAIWQNLMLERFLVRLARSDYEGHFILKGGHLLAKYVQIGRETQDLDFFVRNLKNEVNVLEGIFKAITRVEIGDGFEFKDVVVNPLSHHHMPYLGASISMLGNFGKIRFKVSIDLGFGDLVRDIKKEIILLANAKGPLFEKTIQLNCYPQEFIFSEKLETVIYRGAANSRMKDFHDLYSMISEGKSLDIKTLEESITLVFAHRKTSLHLPIWFSGEEIKSLESYWASYYQKLNHRALKMPPPLAFPELIRSINDWLDTHTKLLKQ